MCMKHGICFDTRERGVKFHLRGIERAISRNGLAFDNVCVSERQGTWRTDSGVTDEAQKEVRYNNTM